MSDECNVMQRIDQMRRSFLEKNQRWPTKVTVTPQDEFALEDLAFGFFPDSLAHAIIANGVRRALPTLRGMAIEWDAKTTKVE